MSVSRQELADCLRGHRVEIEHALLARTAAVPGGEPIDDWDYREGFRATIPAAFDLTLVVIVSREGEVPPIPAGLLHHARLAARHRVGLDTVLRGYVAGSTLLDHFILKECDRGDIQTLLRLRAIALEHLLSRVSQEYEAERQSRDSSRAARTLERVRGLLEGELSSAEALDHPFASNHVGLVARGSDPKNVVTTALRPIDCRTLVVSSDLETVWAWLSRREPLHAEEVAEVAAPLCKRGVSLGIGEPAHGTAGWRQTHRQARAALQVAMRLDSRTARYGEVCLTASAMQDDLLNTFLTERYLRPLLVGRDGGASHLRTLRVYFASHRNGESAAAALKVSRQAVANRLRVIEERLGRPIHSCAPYLEAALRLEELRMP